MLAASPRVVLAAPTDPTEAFEKAFATSLYVFDACGDQLGGKLFRQVLADKMAHCAIPGDAQARYRQHILLLLKRQKDRMNKIVEERGGLPNSLQGMTTTCHAQQTSPAYADLRTKLDAYVKGQTDPETIIPGACDAGEFAP